MMESLVAICAKAAFANGQEEPCWLRALLYVGGAGTQVLAAVMMGLKSFQAENGLKIKSSAHPSNILFT